MEMGQVAKAAGYIVPTYQAAPLAVWYHFLHGNVPGHEIDFIYRPEVPQGPVSQQHFSHLVRLLRYIEPWSRSSYAFAIGNLSRDDTQYEPGRGGVALIFGLRIQGAKDHAGRADPPFCHAIAAIDRQLDPAWLREVALSFHQKLLPGEDTQASGSGWYHTYLKHGRNADALMPILRGYVGDFEDLPEPPPSALGFRWTVENATPPKRVVIVYREDEAFDVIATCAARIAAVLIESDIKWTAVSTGRDADVVGGVSVRFVPEHEVRSEEEGVPVLWMKDVPEDAGEIASRLFGASEVRVSQVPQLRMGWQLYGRRGGSEGPRAGDVDSVLKGNASSSRPEGDGEIVVDVGEDGGGPAVVGISAGSTSEKRAESERQNEGLGNAQEVGRENERIADERAVPLDGRARKRSRGQFGLLIALGMAIVIGGSAAVVAIGTKGSEKEEEPGTAATTAGEQATPIQIPEGTAPGSAGASTQTTAPSLGAVPSGSVSAPSSTGLEASTDTKDKKSGGRSKPEVKNKKKTSVFEVPYR